VRSVLLLGIGLAATAGPAVAAGDAGLPGTPVTPGTNVQETAPVGSGLYTLPVAQGSEEQYVEVRRTVPGSTIWYGASALVPGSTRTTSPTLVLESSPDGTGDACVDYESLGTSIGESGIASRLFSTDHDAGCRRADSVVLRTAQDDMPAGDFQLVVWEEPPVTNAETLPEQSLSVTWTPVSAADPQQLEAGRTFGEAPEVDDGTYEVHVDPGEPALLAIPLTWGQHAQVEATSSTRVRGYAAVAARWFGPLGGTLGDAAYSGGPASREISLDGSGDPAAWVTPTVAWRNREGPADQAPAAFAGTYYLSIDTAAQDVPPEGVDLTLTVARVTDYPAKAPEYDEQPPPMPYVDGSEAGSAVRASRDTSDQGPPWVLVGGLVGAAGAFGAAGTVLLSRRRAHP
jgi:hypothetical protein